MKIKKAKLVQQFNDTAVVLYKLIAIPVLFALMFWTISYLAVTGFYLTSSRWAVPFVAGPAQERVMREQAAYGNYYRNLSSLKKDASNYKSQVDVQNEQSASLEQQFALSLDAFVVQQSSSLADLSANAPKITKKEDVEKQKLFVIRKFKMRLITSDQMQRELFALNRYALKFSNRDVAKEIPVVNDVIEAYQKDQDKDVLLDKLSQNPIDGQSSKLVRDMMDINTKFKTLKANMRYMTDQLNQIYKETAYYETLVKGMQESPLVAASAGSMPLAFIPYTNISYLEVGAPIYSCMFYFVLCEQVGKVTEISNQEVNWQHPLFNNVIRGVIAKLEVADTSKIQELIILLKRPPLFF